MELRPCTDDLITICTEYIIFLVCGFILCNIFNWYFLVIIGVSIFEIVVLIETIRLFLYFARTITLDQNGVTFILRGFSNFYSWQELNVKYYDGNEVLFHDGDISGPGIMICPRSSNVSGKLSPMTFCQRRHPLTSVFLRYKPDQTKITGKITTNGFTIARNDAATFFDLSVLE